MSKFPPTTAPLAVWSCDTAGNAPTHEPEPGRPEVTALSEPAAEHEPRYGPASLSGRHLTPRIAVHRSRIEEMVTMNDARPVRPRVLARDEGEALWFLGNLVTVKAAAADTGGRVSVVEFLNPPGFAPPLHRHLREDEMFLVLDGAATFHCDGDELPAGPGDFVLLPVGLAHTFRVTSAEPLRTLQITTPGGFEEYAALVGGPATERRLPRAAPVDPAVLAHAGELHGVQILGPPPAH